MEEKAQKEIDERAENAAEYFEDELKKLIRRNKNKIITAYRNTVTEDNFGKKITKRFDAELIKFIKDELPYAIHRLETDVEIDDWRAFWPLVAEEFRKNYIEKPYKKELENRSRLFKSAREYELYCAEMFKAAGWDAKATKSSGDQGVDVEAKRNGVLLVAQCKKFAKPVGNKAVQEIIAGQNFYAADRAVVIATNGFTKSARQLAAASGVELIHQDDIGNL